MGYRYQVFVAAAGLCLGACAPTGPRTVADPDPAIKVPAIKEAVRTHDMRVVPQLIKELNNDDPAIRFYAIDALRSLTGQDLGYRYYDEDEQRKPAVARWNQWYSNQSAKQPSGLLR